MLSSKTRILFSSYLSLTWCNTVRLAIQLDAIQMDVGSELVDWYRDATSVPDGLLMIDLSPRTDDRLRYCTNTGSIPSKLYIQDLLKQSKLLYHDHTKCIYSPSVPIIFPQMQKSFPSVLPKRICQVPLRMYSKSSQMKLAEHEKTSPAKISKQGSTILSATYNLEAEKRRSGVRKFVKTLKSI